MPDYPIERTIRRAPGAIVSLLRSAGLMDGGSTPELADEWGRSRTDEPSHSTNPLIRAGERAVAAMGLYPLPDETKPQFQDAVYGAPDKWFPTAGLARRASGQAPHDINLPNESGGGAGDPRWKDFAMTATRRR